MARKPLLPPSAPEPDGVISSSQALYLDWLTDPQRVGSKQDQADLHGVNRSTITRWENNGAFVKAWADRVRELGGSPDRLQKAYDAMYEKGLQGDVNAMKLWLMATGHLNQVQEVAVHKSARDLSDDELAALLSDRARVERDRRGLRAVGADA